MFVIYYMHKSLNLVVELTQWKCSQCSYSSFNTRIVAYSSYFDNNQSFFSINNLKGTYILRERLVQESGENGNMVWKQFITTSTQLILYSIIHSDIHKDSLIETCWNVSV